MKQRQERVSGDMMKYNSNRGEDPKPPTREKKKKEKKKYILVLPQRRQKELTIIYL